MALESLKAKLSSLLGSSAPAPINKPAPLLPFSLPRTNLNLANSTPAFTDPSQGTVNQIKSGLKYLNPIQTTERRPLFARADQTVKLGGGPIIGFAHDIVARSIEAIPSIALTTLANFRQIGSAAGGELSEGRVNIPFDASRLGLTEETGQKFVQDSGSKMIANFDKYEAAHPGRTGTNIALASLSPVIDALDAVAGGELLTSVAKQGLKATRFSPELDKALQQYGIKGLSGEEFATEFTKRFNDKARRLILKEDHAGLDELGRATNVILTNMTGRGVPALSRFGKLIQDVSRMGLQDAKYGFTLKNPMFSEIAPRSVPQALPGYVIEPGQAPAMGLSTRRVRRVGGAEGDPAAGPYFRSAEGGSRFDEIQDKEVMPAPIREDLDTFVVKEDEGYAVIEGQSGQQIGETQKTMAEAVSSAKKAIDDMPEGQLAQLLDESPLSPRYEQADEKPEKSRRATARAAEIAKKTPGVRVAAEEAPKKEPEAPKKPAPRPNKKLDERAAEASSFDEFYQRSGVTMESLDATARKKGFEDAREFYDARRAAKSEEESLVRSAEQADESAFSVRASEREAERIDDNLRQIFASMKGVDVGDLKPKFTDEQLDQARMQYEFLADELEDHPGRSLIRFVSKKEGQFLEEGRDFRLAKTTKEAERIRQRSLKLANAAQSAFEGTKWSDNFEDPDVIREAIDDYIARRDELKAVREELSNIRRSVNLGRQTGTFLENSKRKLAKKTLQQTKALADLFAAAERSGYRRGVKEGSRKYNTLVSNLRERRQKLASLQEVYDLTDAEFAKIRGQKDPRFLTKQEFDQYVAGLETAIQKIVARRQERVIVDALIKEKDLKKVDNLRKALQFPKMENMNIDQLRELGDILAKTAPGDTFLGPRMIQTAKNTELGDIKTMAEGRAAIATRLGLDPKDVQETADADVFLDKFLRDPAWAERDALRKTVVLDWAAGDVQRLNKQRLLRRQIEDLAKASRKSRRKAGGVLGTFREKLLSRFSKTDDMVSKYMETLPDGLPALEKKMTPEEIAFGKFGRELMQKYYQYSMDDAAQRWTLAGIRHTRFKDMYLPHMGPKFFERWQRNGFVNAVKNLFGAVQETKVDFNAYGDRGEVLGYEKFFKNAQKRENLATEEYSKNVASVLMRYVDAFEKKILLDGQIPKIKLLEQLLGRKYRTPKTITNPEGTEKVSSNLTRVLNEWINNKKGQKIETIGIQQGSQVEKFLQSANMLISLYDLGGNLVTQTASGAGAEIFNVLSYARGGGGVKGWLKGHGRALTKQGRKIAHENPGVIEEAPWRTIADSFSEAGQTLMSSLFYVFADLAYRARRQLFLGQLTKEEFKSGVISPKRLAEIKLNIGKVHAMPEFRSVAGSTALAQIANKYTEWAVPNFQTSAGILKRVVADAKAAKAKGGTEGLKQFMKTRAYRDAVITALVGIGGYALGQIIFAPDEKDQSPAGKWRQKFAREMASVIQSSTGIGVFTSARSLDMLDQLQNVITLAITMERYEKDGKGYKEGDLKFPNAAQRLLIPGSVRNLLPEEKSSSSSSGGASGRRGNRSKRGSSSSRRGSSGRKRPKRSRR